MRMTGMKGFFFATLTIAALSAAVVVTHSSRAAAEPPGWGCYHSGHACE